MITGYTVDGTQQITEIRHTIIVKWMRKRRKFNQHVTRMTDDRIVIVSITINYTGEDSSLDRQNADETTMAINL